PWPRSVLILPESPQNRHAAGDVPSERYRVAPYYSLPCGECGCGAQNASVSRWQCMSGLTVCQALGLWHRGFSSGAQMRIESWIATWYLISKVKKFRERREEGRCMPNAYEQYQHLVARIDAFGQAICQRYPTQVTCHAGCDGCCYQQFTVF